MKCEKCGKIYAGEVCPNCGTFNEENEKLRHERIRYETVKKNYFNDTTKDCQMMLLPDIITLTHKEVETIKENVETGKNHGVFATETETEEPPTTEAPTTEPPPTDPPLLFSKTDPLLVLVNKDREYAGEAPEVKQWRTGGISVSTEAYDALASMIDAGQKLGLRFVVCSGYRSREVQEQLFQEDLNRYMRGGMSYEEAWTATERYTMPPGHSEHCTGLAVDIVAQSNQHLDSTQESTAETRWLQTHCWEYGFVLRYPKDKSSITGIAYESWHYRYVGKEAAKYLTENNLTLEEFHDQT